MRYKPTLLVLFASLSVACTPVAARATATSAGGSAATADVGTTPKLPEATSPPTSTPAPAPRTFQEDFQGGLGQWSFLQVDNGSTAPDPRLSAGYLRFDLTGTNQWLYALYAPHNYTDVRVDASIAFGSGNNAAGVVCRYSKANGWYEFNIYPDQTYVLLYGQWLAPGVARYTPLFRSSSEKIRADENDIGLLCQGNVLTPFINGVQLRQRPENTFGLTNGQVGLSAASFETAPISILVDWVKVAEP